MTDQLTRRQFTTVAGLAAGAAAIAAVASPALAAEPSAKADSAKAASAAAASAAPSAQEECDVLVIGAGGAGATAAAMAAQAGASVIILEKGDIQAGSSALALGTFYGAGTTLQQAAGIDDTPDALLDYFLSCNGDKLALDIQRFAAENYGDTIDWLVNDMQVPFKDKVSLKGKDTVARGHNCANTAADALDAVTTLATDNGADLRFGMKAEELVMDESGAVTGVIASDNSGERTEFVAKKTIIATGGFCRNDEMIAKYMPDYKGVYTEVGTGCTGEGLQMGLDKGARYVGHGGTNGILFCAVQTGQSKLIANNVLWLDKDGQRFVSEAGQTHDIYYQVAHFDGQHFYAVYDQAARDALDEKLADKFQKGLDDGIFAQGDTVAEAAEALGLPGDAFQASLDAYNAMCEAGEDTQFGKKAELMVPLETGPFYVLTMGVCTHGTFGGYEVNADMQVMSEIGLPIPNLYAAGEVSCGTFIYDDYPAGGCGLNWAYTSGRFAGTNAAQAALGIEPEPAAEA